MINATRMQKFFLVLSRITIGWMFFYAGITKVIDPQWSAEGYLKGAKSFVWLFQALLDPNILPIINLINKWGLTLLGVSLIIGLFVRFSSILGVLLMALYYLALNFPHPNANAYIVDQHLIYVSILLFFASIQAGRIFGIDGKRVHHHSGWKKWLG